MEGDIQMRLLNQCVTGAHWSLRSFRRHGCAAIRGVSRFRVSHLLGVMVIVSVLLASLTASARRQKDIVRFLNVRGITAYYESEMGYAQFAFFDLGGTTPHNPMGTCRNLNRFEAWVGEIDVDLVDSVTGVDLMGGGEELLEPGEDNSDAASRVVDSKVLERIVSIPTLQWLSLGDGKLERHALAELPSATHLRYLHLERTNVHDRDLRHVAELENIEDLVLDGTSIGDRALEYVRNLVTLRYLSLSKTNVTDAGLARLKGLVRLEVLDLSDTRISDQGIRMLGTLPALREINVGQTNVTNYGVYALLGMPQLKHISAYDTEVTVSGTLKGGASQVTVQSALGCFGRTGKQHETSKDK